MAREPCAIESAVGLVIRTGSLKGALSGEVMRQPLKGVALARGIGVRPLQNEAPSHAAVRTAELAWLRKLSPIGWQCGEADVAAVPIRSYPK